MGVVLVSIKVSARLFRDVTPSPSHPNHPSMKWCGCYAAYTGGTVKVFQLGTFKIIVTMYKKKRRSDSSLHFWLHYIEFSCKYNFFLFLTHCFVVAYVVVNTCIATYILLVWLYFRCPRSLSLLVCAIFTRLCVESTISSTLQGSSIASFSRALELHWSRH